MSRIEDDRDAARLTERLSQAKRAEEQKKSERTTADSAFRKLVQKGQGEQVQKQQDSVGRSAIAQMLEKEKAAEHADGTARESGVNQQEQARGAESRTNLKGFDEKLKQANTSEGERSTQSKDTDKAADGEASAGRSTDRAGGDTRTEGRKGDAKVSREKAEEKKESSDAKASGGSKGGGAVSEKGDLKADTDKGGQGGKQDNSKGGEAAAAPGFRFNPALMAPMPVQQASNTAANERLRKLANEIAQKIVERVRVGTNAAGKSEFQIDLKDNVLSGLTVKVSSSGGKIKAVFSGRDPKILKMIGEQSEALKKALSGRGLELDEFKIEDLA
jgi:hypothetical protein